MSITCDFHMHSSFSEDSHAPMEDMVNAALQKGLKVICFTEHMDLDYPKQYGTFQVNLPEYTAQLFRLKSLYQGKIDIRLGLELGMQPHLASRYTSLAGEYPFDFLIASQHLLDGYDPYYPEYWETHSEHDTYERYFTHILENLKLMEEYDTLGHLDYIVRYGPNKNTFYSYEQYAASIDAVLRCLIDRGKCLEVNAAGLKYGLGHPNPDESVLRRYLELGGELITIGSDGHSPNHIAYDFDRVASLLKELGFRYYTIFKDRKPEEILL